MTAVDYCEVNFVDVGQGDCTLIVLPGLKHERFQILIDCGSLGGARENWLSNFQDAADNPYIDLLLITHPDRDHFNLISSLNDYGWMFLEVCWGGTEDLKPLFVKNVGAPEAYERANNCRLMPYARRGVQPSTPPPTPTYKALGGALKKDFPAASAISVSVTFSVIYSNSSAASANDQSLVSLLRISGTKGSQQFFFGGDLTETGEQNLLADPALEKALKETTVLKLNHHGSKGSNCDAFLKTLSNLRVVTTSCEEDQKYSHPSADVLERLRMLNGPGQFLDSKRAVNGQLAFGAWWVPARYDASVVALCRHVPALGTSAGSIYTRVSADPTTGTVCALFHQQCVDSNGAIFAQECVLRGDGHVELVPNASCW